jgi:hypothetical protein|tara:strand:+ start:878 stop:1183 length:306 start_codon:yes stop_codon:yes gene_type:complete
MPRYKMLNGTRMQYTAEEEAAKDAEEAEFEAGRFDHDLGHLRVKRNILLNETDWVVTKASETNTSISADWKTYRQELRDLPSGLTTVEEVAAVTFPTKPGA